MWYSDCAQAQDSIAADMKRSPMMMQVCLHLESESVSRQSTRTLPLAHGENWAWHRWLVESGGTGAEAEQVRGRARCTL